MAKTPDSNPAPAGTKIPVTMTDGRVVEFNPKQRLVKTSTIDEDKGTVDIRLDFPSGETRTFSARADMLLRFAAHGAEQKLGDVIAGEADAADALLAMDNLIERLNAGEWASKRKAGEFAGQSILMRALVEATGKPAEAVKAVLDTKSQAEKLAMRRSSKLKPIIDRLEAEKESKSKTAVDVDALFSEIDAI